MSWIAACGSASKSHHSSSSAAGTSPFCLHAAALVQTFGTPLSHDPSTFSTQLQRTVRLLHELLPYATSASLRADIGMVASSDAGLAEAVHPGTGHAQESRVRAAYSRSQASEVTAAGRRLRASILASCHF